MFEGEIMASFRACDACINETQSELDRVRPVFDAMIAVGLDRELANEVMSTILERIYPQT